MFLQVLTGLFLSILFLSGGWDIAFDAVCSMIEEVDIYQVRYYHANVCTFVFIVM